MATLAFSKIGATSVLARRNLVVPGLDRHPDLVELPFGLHHERQNAVGDGSEVVVLHLLTLRRARAEERPAGVDEIRPIEIELPVDQEILLFGTARRHDPLRLGAKELQDAHGLLGEGFHRAQERRLLVQRLTRPAHEGRGNDERRAVGRDEQPRRAGGVPGRVAARFERGPHAAGRKAGGVGLALRQFLAAELGNGAAVGRRREKRVVLLRGDAGQRLEPVCVVRGAVLDRPVLERAGDDVGHRRIERFALRDGASQRAIRVLRQPGTLRFVVEGQRTKFLTGLPARRAAAVHGLAPVTDVANGVACRCGTHD